MVSVNKTAMLAPGGDQSGNGAVNPGDTLKYGVTVSNTGTEAMNVIFSDQLDPNLALVPGSVTASPIAANDSYASIGNAGITVPAANGVRANDVNPQGSGTLVVTAVTNGMTAQGGSYALAADGGFSYNPPVGFEGADSFVYTLTHNPNGQSDTGTVNLTVSGMLWFVNNAAASCTTIAAGCGRLNSPFSTLAAFNTANTGGGANPDNNDNIFVYESGTQYTGAVTLRTGQKLIGQDASTTLAGIAGITLPPFSNALPAMNAGNAAITNLGSTVTLNTNATVRGLSINSTTNTGLNDPAGAITGVSVSEVAIASTTGTAVLLSSLGGTLSFRSISANGGANGISLTSTTGSFTVEGDGVNTTRGGNNSGGMIRNLTGADGATSGIGILLNNVQNITLRRMHLHDFQNFGIRGTNVTNFAFDYSKTSGTNGTNHSAVAFEGSVAFTDLKGAVSFTGSDLSGGHTENLRVVNDPGVGRVIDRLTVSNTTIGRAESNDGMLVESRDGTVNVTIENSDFTAAPGDLLQINLLGAAVSDVVITGTHFSNNHPFIAGGGITLSGGGSGSNPTMTFNLTGNTFRDAVGTPLAITKGSGAGNFSGVIHDNTIGVPGIADSGSTAGSGISVGLVGAGTFTTSITNNKIYQYNNFGILVIPGDANTGNGAMNATITGNQISNPGTGTVTGGLAINGIHLNAGQTVPDQHQVCLDIGGAGALANSITGSGKFGGADFRLRQRQSTTVRLPGYGGANNNDAAVVAFVRGRNGGTPTGEATNTVPTGGGFVGGAACAMPSFAPLTEIGLATPRQIAPPGLLARVWQWVSPYPTVL